MVVRCQHLSEGQINEVEFKSYLQLSSLSICLTHVIVYYRGKNVVSFVMCVCGCSGVRSPEQLQSNSDEAWLH